MDSYSTSETLSLHTSKESGRKVTFILGGDNDVIKHKYTHKQLQTYEVLIYNIKLQRQKYIFQQQEKKDRLDKDRLEKDRIEKDRIEKDRLETEPFIIINLQ